MKRIFKSFLLTLICVAVISGSCIPAFADGWINHTQEITIDTTYTDSCMPNEGDGYGDIFKFYVPLPGIIEFDLKTEYQRYFYGSNDGPGRYVSEKGGYVYYSRLGFSLIYEEALESPIATIDRLRIYSVNNETDSYNSAYGYYTYSCKFTIPKAGYYYLKVSYPSSNASDYTGYTYDFSLNFTASVPCVNNLKVSSRSTSSITLLWNKSSSVTGYQVQRKSGSSYKTVATVTSNKATIKELKAGTVYSFRVRSYKKYNGKTYYSNWTDITAPTTPATVSLLTPTTNTKHAVTAKWKSVAAGTGYQVQFSTSKTFASSVTKKTVKGKDKGSVSITGKKGKTYYIRVRAYVTCNGTNYYGAWSKTTSVKCK